MLSHFRHVTRFFSPCKRIDFCPKISIILVSITRPNSTENITYSNIYNCPKQTICTQILPYKTVVSSFTLRCRSPRQSPSARGAPPREQKMRHALFLLFSQAASFLFFPFFSAFSFSCFRCCGPGANFIFALYVAITLSKSSTRRNTSFSTPDLI